MSTADVDVAAAAPTRPHSGAEKAAILLLTLGPDVAGGVVKHLTETEVRQLAQAMGRVRTIPRGEAKAVHEEAWRWLTAREGYLVDGEAFVRGIVGTLAGPGASAGRGVPERVDAASSIASRLGGVPAEVLAKVLAEEHPQVAALVVAHLATRQAAEVLVQLPESVQVDLVYRIAELKAVPEDVLEDVGSAIAGQVERLGATQSGVQTGGAKFAAEVMNLVGSFAEQRIFAGLDERSTAVADTIRSLMLTFDDLQRLDNRGMQTLLKEVGRDELLLAMKTASPTMREKILTNLSARARDIMQEDLATLGPVRLKDVERAQAVIVFAARRLAEEQKIHLGLSLDDALV